jgi:hypothetical protein
VQVSDRVVCVLLLFWDWNADPGAKHAVCIEAMLSIHHMPGTYIYDCTHLQSTAVPCLLNTTLPS